MRSVVGLIPAAGTARRLGYQTQSKEILPVVFGHQLEGAAGSAIPACNYLLDGLSNAGVTSAFMVLRCGKWDIPTTLLRNPVPNISISYIMIEETAGVPWTLDRAYDFVRESDVLLGFPDILIRPKSFYRKLLEALQGGTADVVLALLPTAEPSKFDAVELDDSGEITRIRPKPDDLTSANVWTAAAWRPSFTKYLHEYLSKNPEELNSERELYLGDIFSAALLKLKVSTFFCHEATCIDIGTPEDLAKVSGKT